MFATEELNLLAARRAALLAQSAGNRAALTRACADLQQSAGWIEVGYNFVSKTRSAALFAAPVLGFLAAWRWPRAVRWGRRLGLVVRLVRRVAGIWRGVPRQD